MAARPDIISTRTLPFRCGHPSAVTCNHTYRRPTKSTAQTTCTMTLELVLMCMHWLKTQASPQATEDYRLLRLPRERGCSMCNGRHYLATRKRLALIAHFLHVEYTPVHCLQDWLATYLYLTRDPAFPDTRQTYHIVCSWFENWLRNGRTAQLHVGIHLLDQRQANPTLLLLSCFRALSTKIYF